MNAPILAWAAAGLLLAPAATAQMGKRKLHRYDPARYARTAPAVGTQAPPLALPDLEGRTRTLASLHGKRLVLIGGGFT